MPLASWDDTWCGPCGPLPLSHDACDGRAWAADGHDLSGVSLVGCPYDGPHCRPIGSCCASWSSFYRSLVFLACPCWPGPCPETDCLPVAVCVLVAAVFGHRWTRRCRLKRTGRRPRWCCHCVKGRAWSGGLNRVPVNASLGARRRAGRTDRSTCGPHCSCAGDGSGCCGGRRLGARQRRQLTSPPTLVARWLSPPHSSRHWTRVQLRPCPLTPRSRLRVYCLIVYRCYPYSSCGSLGAF